MTTKGPKATRALTALAALALASAPSACREAKLESVRPPVPVVVDGSAREWAGREAYYNPEEGLKIGFFNDDRFLYVYFAAWHRETQARILANGFTGWFDVTGGRKKTFGIVYPLARRRPGGGFGPGQREGMPPGHAGEAAPEGPSSEGGMRAGGSQRGSMPGARDMEPAAVMQLLAESRGELAFVDAARDTVYLPAAADSGGAGIAAMIGFANRTLVIEARIPLDRTGAVPDALAAGPGDRIGVGFEIGEMPRPEGAPRGERPSVDMGGAPPGGMGGGGMGGFGGGGMGPPGAMGGDFQEKFEWWAKVRLAGGR